MKISIRFLLGSLALQVFGCIEAPETQSNEPAPTETTIDCSTCDTRLLVDMHLSSGGVRGTCNLQNQELLNALRIWTVDDRLVAASALCEKVERTWDKDAFALRLAAGETNERMVGDVPVDAELSVARCPEGTWGIGFDYDPDAEIPAISLRCARLRFEIIENDLGERESVLKRHDIQMIPAITLGSCSGENCQTETQTCRDDTGGSGIAIRRANDGAFRSFELLCSPLLLELR